MQVPQPHPGFAGSVGLGAARESAFLTSSKALLLLLLQGPCLETTGLGNTSSV